jgi:hypothetical protein
LQKAVSFLNAKGKSLAASYDHKSQTFNNPSLAQNGDHKTSYLQNFLDLYKTLSFGDKTEVAAQNKKQFMASPVLEISNTKVSYLIFTGVFTGLGIEFRNLIVNVFPSSEFNPNSNALFFQNSILAKTVEILQSLFKEKNQSLMVI